MNLNVADWKRFALGRLFDIKKGKRLTSEDQEDGDNLYIGAIDSNNGVANRIGQKPIHDGNTISLSYNGSVGEAFYQPEPYWATDDVNALYSRYDGFDESIGLFIAAVIRQEKYRFSYGRKWTLNNMNITEICLPVQHNADGSILIDGTCKYSDEGYTPDWQFMEDYIKSLHYKPLTTKNKREQTPDLNVQNWKEFTIEGLFPKLVKGKCGDASSLIDGNDVNYIGAKYDNNGVMKSCSLYDNLDFVSKGNCIAMIGQGQGSAGYAIYLDTDFIGATSLTLGYADWINPYTAHFVTTLLCLEYDKYSFGRSWTGDRLKETIVKLPVGSDGDPDWQFMENYIKALPYGDRLVV